jgi:type II secretory pathway pseudopilin PulG
MKTAINIVLVLCACALVYVCYLSITGPINFEEEKVIRDQRVTARLIDIRKAQQEYRTQHKQQYTASFDTLIHFVKTGRIPFVSKEGNLSDKQLEDGMTELKAMQIINKAKKTGNWSDVQKNGLEAFRRDTFWVAVIDTVFPKGFNADSLRYIPFTDGAQYEMDTVTYIAKSGPLHLVEVRAPYDVYLSGLDKQETINVIDLQKKKNKYPGLAFGSLESPNNNAGNWE